MSEIVVDAQTGDIALIAVHRAKRPNEFRNATGAACPFCPGNEDETPPEVAAYRDADGAWSVRAFRNKFPALEPPEGDHEVIVDTPEHDAQFTGDGVRMWRDRFVAALARFPEGVPVIFKNCGAQSGATIEHPHTQLLVLRMPVPRWETMRARGEEYFTRQDSCAWCDEARDAECDGLMVERSQNFTAYIRPAARFTNTLTILPSKCVSTPATMSEAQCIDLADLLNRAAAALKDGLSPEGAFNIVVPADAHARRGAFHWHLEVIPRASMPAAFELATGIHIKTTGAQESAEHWRRMLRARGPV